MNNLLSAAFGFSGKGLASELHGGGRWVVVIGVFPMGDISI